MADPFKWPTKSQLVQVQSEPFEWRAVPRWDSLDYKCSCLEWGSLAWNSFMLLAFGQPNQLGELTGTQYNGIPRSHELELARFVRSNFKFKFKFEFGSAQLVLGSKLASSELKARLDSTRLSWAELGFSVVESCSLFHSFPCFFSKIYLVSLDLNSNFSLSFSNQSERTRLNENDCCVERKQEKRIFHIEN